MLKLCVWLIILNELTKCTRFDYNLERWTAIFSNMGSINNILCKSKQPGPLPQVLAIFCTNGPTASFRDGRILNARHQKRLETLTQHWRKFNEKHIKLK
jgi:hypothetical protein